MLAGVDLRGQDLTARDLRNANLQGANLRGMQLTDTRLAGADLRGADLTGVRMVRGDLGGAQTSGSQWHRAALLGVTGLDKVMHTPELAVAAVAGRDHADVMLASSGTVSSVAFSPDGTLLAVPRGEEMEIVDLVSGDALRVLSGHTVRVWDPVTGAMRATLVALDAGGYAVLLPDGSYRLKGDPRRTLWWTIKLCRFAPGELDPYDSTIRRLPAEAPILG